MIQVLLGELSEQETEVILRPIRSDLVAHNGESVGHDFWGDSGDNVYASAFGSHRACGGAICRATKNACWLERAYPITVRIQKRIGS